MPISYNSRVLREIGAPHSEGHGNVPSEELRMQPSFAKRINVAEIEAWTANQQRCVEEYSRHMRSLDRIAEAIAKEELGK
jgi:hypothetical protein